MNNPKTTSIQPVTMSLQTTMSHQTTARVLFITRFIGPNTCVAMETLAGKSVFAIIRRAISRKERVFLRENIHIITKENDVWVINM